MDKILINEEESRPVYKKLPGLILVVKVHLLLMPGGWKLRVELVQTILRLFTRAVWGGDRLFVLLGNLKAYQATVAEIRTGIFRQMML